MWIPISMIALNVKAPVQFTRLDFSIIPKTQQLKSKYLILRPVQFYDGGGINGKLQTNSHLCIYASDAIHIPQLQSPVFPFCSKPLSDKRNLYDHLLRALSGGIKPDKLDNYFLSSPANGPGWQQTAVRKTPFTIPLTAHFTFHSPFPGTEAAICWSKKRHGYHG